MILESKYAPDAEGTPLEKPRLEKFWDAYESVGKVELQVVDLHQEKTTLAYDATSGHTYGSVDGPNLYTYVRQNPWSKFDPHGLSAEDVATAHVEAMFTGKSTSAVLASRIEKPAPFMQPSTVQISKNSGLVRGMRGLADFAADVTPVVSAGKGLTEAVTGTNPVTQEKLGTGDRVLAAFGLIPGGKIAGKLAKNVGGLFKRGKKSTTAIQTNKANKARASLPEHTAHSLNQKINRKVKTADELDALRNPLQKTEIKIDSQGRPSQRLVGEKATLAVNPETNKIVSVNPTSTKKANKLKKQKQQQKEDQEQ